MTHYWDQKTRLSVNAHDDSAKMKTGKETLKQDSYSDVLLSVDFAEG